MSSGKPGIRFALVLAGLAVAAWGRWWLATPLTVREGTIALVIGCLFAAFALGRPGAGRDGQESNPLSTVSSWGPREWLGLVVLLGGLAGFGWSSFQLYAVWDSAFDWAAPLAVGCLAVWTAGLALVDRRWRNPEGTTPWSRPEILGVLLLTALAGFLRFHQLDHFPPADGFVAIEEPQSGQGAWNILSEGIRPWEFLLDRWMAVPFLDWLGPTITNLRLPFILVSWLTIPVTYLLARQLVAPGAAMFGTFLLAVSHWHLHYARLAHAVFPTTLVFVGVLALCVRQYRRGGLALYPWIGFWSAYTLFAYAGYRATLLVVAAFFLTRFLVLLRDWWRAAEPETASLLRRRVGVQLVGMTLLSLGAAGPVVALAGRLSHNPQYFLEALNRSRANKEYYTDDWETWIRARVQRQIDTARIFHHRGDTEQAYNLPGEPMLDPVTGVLFTIAVFYGLLFWRHRLQGFFVLTFLGLVIAGLTLTQTLVVCRIQGAVPVLFVVIAFAADRFAQLSRAALGRLAPAFLGVAATGVGAAALALNWDTYFVRSMNSPEMRAVFRNHYTFGIRYLHSLPDGAYLSLVSDLHNFFEPSDYAWWRGERIPGQSTSDLLPALQGGPAAAAGRQRFVLLQPPFERASLGALVAEAYPASRCIMDRHPEGYPHLDQLGCDLGDAPPQPLPTTLRARYFRLDEGSLVLERDEPAISWGLVPDTCTWMGNRGAYRCRAEWTGRFFVAEEGRYDVIAEGRLAEVAVTIDGQPASLGMALAAGIHELRATATFQEEVNTGLRVLWNRSGEGEPQLLRFRPAPEQGNELP